ncbi:hypothetical protein T439DRAFT_367432 [Meredithblackwellia eburnea MCA 4105]
MFFWFKRLQFWVLQIVLLTSSSFRDTHSVKLEGDAHNAAAATVLDCAGHSVAQQHRIHRILVLAVENSGLGPHASCILRSCGFCSAPLTSAPWTDGSHLVRRTSTSLPRQDVLHGSVPKTILNDEQMTNHQVRVNHQEQNLSNYVFTISNISSYIFASEKFQRYHTATARGQLQPATVSTSGAVEATNVPEDPAARVSDLFWNGQLGSVGGRMFSGGGGGGGGYGGYGVLHQGVGQSSMVPQSATEMGIAAETKIKAYLRESGQLINYQTSFRHSVILAVQHALGNGHLPHTGETSVFIDFPHDFRAQSFHEEFSRHGYEPGYSFGNYRPDLVRVHVHREKNPKTKHRELKVRWNVVEIKYTAKEELTRVSLHSNWSVQLIFYTKNLDRVMGSTIRSADIGLGATLHDGIKNSGDVEVFLTNKVDGTYFMESFSIVFLALIVSILARQDEFDRWLFDTIPHAISLVHRGEHVIYNENVEYRKKLAKSSSKSSKHSKHRDHRPDEDDEGGGYPVMRQPQQDIGSMLHQFDPNNIHWSQQYSLSKFMVPRSVEADPATRGPSSTDHFKLTFLRSNSTTFYARFMTMPSLFIISSSSTCNPKHTS